MVRDQKIIIKVQMMGGGKEVRQKELQRSSELYLTKKGARRHYPVLVKLEIKA